MPVSGSILFLFKSGRESRLAENGPREFFYGFTEMEKLGIDARLLEEDGLPAPALSGLGERLATRLFHPLTGLNAGTLSRLAARPALERLNQAQAIVATTNAQGLALGALKTLRRLSPPVLFLPMGVLSLHEGALRKQFLSCWLRHLSLAPISSAEESWLAGQLDRRIDLSYLPFGADTAFWSPDPAEQTGGYAFAIGNDLNRDWDTLARAWTPDLPLLKLVTRLPVPPSDGHIETMAGDWRSRPISDMQIRTFYRESLFVVLPIQETIQPSGQSACLQAMACGKAVILSAIKGLWDGELLKDGETCLLIPPGDPKALARAAARLAASPDLARRLGDAARETVMRRFTIERMGEAMAARLRSLAAIGRIAP